MIGWACAQPFPTLATPLSIVYHNTTVASNDKDRATLFNQYLHSIFNCASSNPPEPSGLSPHPDPISSIKISVEEIYQAIILLDANKAIGIDGIGPKVLKNCALLFVIH